jgi:hypothetical protein
MSTMPRVDHIHPRPCPVRAHPDTDLPRCTSGTLYIPVTRRLYLDARGRALTHGVAREETLRALDERSGPSGGGVGGGGGSGGGGGDTAPAFTVTRGELGELVRAAVREELGHARPLLVDKQQLARQLGCSPAHVDHLRKRGLPTVMLGQAVRFEPGAVLGWLRAQAPNNDQE